MSRFLLLVIQVVAPVLAVMFFGVRPASADGIGVSIDPYLSDISLSAGEPERAFVVTVSNTSDQERTMALSAVDFGTLDASAGTAFLGADGNLEKSFERAEWMELGQDSLTVGPGLTVQIRGTIRDSVSLTPGGHYGAILLRDLGEDSLDMGPTDVSVVQVVSALVFIRKEGGAIYGMEIHDVASERHALGAPDAARMLLRNTGNVHIVPRGVIEVYDPLGKSVSRGVVNEDSLLLLPGTDREFRVRFLRLSSSWLPGRYTVRAALRYDGRDEADVIENRFLVLPPAFSILVIAAVLLVCVGAALFSRSTADRETI